MGLTNEQGPCCRQDNAQQKNQGNGNRADPSGFPIVAHVESASRYEVKLVQETIDSSFTEHAPDKFLGDMAYNIDPLDKDLLQGCPLN